MPRWPRGRGKAKKNPNKGRYWSAPPIDDEERVQRPPGLRGKEIGLFYRDLQKNKPKTERTFTIGLAIPPAIIRQVRNRLQSINQIAVQYNIDLSSVSQIKRIKLEQLEILELKPQKNKNIAKKVAAFASLYDKASSSSEDPSTSGCNQTIDTEHSNSDSSDEGNTPETVFKKPWTEDLMDIPTILKKKPVIPDTVVPFKGSEDFISIKTEKDVIECDATMKELKNYMPKPLPKEETPFKRSEDFISIKTEKDIVECDVKMKELKNDMPKPLPKEEMPVIEPPKPDFITFKGTPSKAEDFIPVNQAETSDYGSGGRKLSLRGTSDYKYGYNDIISGSFDEKLEECLNKGITINNIAGNKNLNDTLYDEYVEMLDNKRYKEMLQFRKKLPTYNKSSELLDVISNNSAVVISGETGCGKSTQVPQLILDDAILNKRGAVTRILVTQPRRIAASSLAERVAAERAERLGQSVGYAVRLEKVDARSRGSITYCTTGILLSEVEVNQGLTNYSHIILDEVHERDVHVDLSMLVLKKILQKRKDLKIILMSATLNAEGLSAYFDNCPMMHIEGLAYPVTDYYLEDVLKMTGFQYDEDNSRPGQGFQRNKNYNSYTKKGMEKGVEYRHFIGPWLESQKHKLDKQVYKTLQDYRTEELSVELIAELILHISRGDPGAILVFVPGIVDITNLLKLLNPQDFPSSKFEIYPLHSKLPSLEQRRIFERPPEGVRKIIVATNIAETSITIDDIVYVIDSGRIKMKGLIVEENVATLKVEWVSQANLRQRRGRAGRCQPGVCYHLLTSYRASKLDERLLPELQRSDLLEPVLMLKQLRLGRAEAAFTLVPDPPAAVTTEWAVKHLQRLGALDSTETLTPLGWHLARLPVHPAAGKLLLLGALFGCLDRAACVAAVWGFKDPFMLVIGKEEESRKCKRQLALGEPSDHVAISEAIITWERSGQHSRTFAYNFFLSNNTLQLLSDMKRQFGDNLKQMGFLPSGDIRAAYENRNAGNISLFKAIVAASLYPNPVRIIARTPEDGRVEIHPSSVMAPSFSPRDNNTPICNNPGAGWLVYWLKQKSSQLFLLEVTLVHTLPLLFFGELDVTRDETDPEVCYMSISTVRVKCNRETTELLLELRALLDHVLANKVMVTSVHAIEDNKFQEEVLSAVIDLITAEDEQVEDDSFGDSDQSEPEPQPGNWRGRR
ncbi:hypothetical protein JYU34_001653 [Plutella xylostella]|uniref:RNA helicase n=1 Tax=Plutella xylostella TaxID=51655 RepID=A0ABQ7R4F7_PLUXY|nr:hypothetical protein JYU34_001653 [Plutella xylostella]